MAKGRKTGGRVAGSRNKVGKEVRDIWRELGGDQGESYARQLHTIATATHGDVHARLKALAIIAPHVWKKLAERIEVSGPEGGPIEVHDHFAVPAPR
jgi:hypothetical protein